MTETQRAQLPSEFQHFIEQRVHGRGSFEVYCEGLPGGSEISRGPHAVPGNGYIYETQLNGRRYRVFPTGKWRDQQTVLEAEIEGIVLDDGLVPGDSPTPAEQASDGLFVGASAPSTTGPNTLLYMIARFSDQSSEPIDEATVLSQMGVVSNFWMNGSGGVVYIHGLVHATQAVDIVHITLPQPSSYGATYNNNFAQLLTDARNAASAQGFNYASYNLDVTVTSNSGFSYAGRSYVGSQGSHWVAGYTSLRTAGHELGHNLGLNHANYWRTDSTLPFGADSNPGGYVADYSNGEWVEYGHYFSVMSAQFGGEWDDATKPIYNAVEKVQLGWLSGSQVRYVTNTGTYRLFRLDARTTVGTPRGIRIETPATDYTSYARRYWLQYRYAPWNTAQSWYQNGVQVDVAAPSYGSDGSIELDMTPYSNDQSGSFFDANNKPGGWWTIDNSDKLDGALIVGRTYDDVNAGIHITPLATGNNGAGEEYIDVSINLGSFSGNHAPVITGFSVSTNQVTPGQGVNFNVSAVDPDGDTLAYSWGFDDSQVWTPSGLNSPAATKSWSGPGQYRVVVRVSDMKGGVTTASQIITVGTPANTGEVWGRVLWGGQAVYGAMVSTTSGGPAWTESDGSYVLTDLVPGNSYSINCVAPGLTFTAQFSNPVLVSAGNIYGADFYANQPLQSGGATTYTISGQVTDPVNGVAGIEVRGGGIVTTTDASGNYQITNFVPGTYVMVPRSQGWNFSPSNRSVTITSASSTGNNFSRVASYSISGNLNGIPAGSQSPAPTVYLSNGRSAVATKAGTGGNRYWTYTLNNVPAGQYSVSAFLSGYSIAPSGFSNPLTILGNVSSVNFTGTTAANIAGAISGRVTQYSAPLAGVSVTAMQGSSTVGSASSDSDGYYRIDDLPAGAYTINATKSGYSFSPGSIGVGSVPSAGNNFTANGPTAPPAISSISANPAVVPAAGGTSALAVVASGSGPLVYSWDALAAPAPVAFNPNDSSSAASTVGTIQSPGLYTFRARVTDTNGFVTTRTINVTASAGTGALAVTPYEIQVTSGQQVSYRAAAWDQMGNPITVSPSWSANGGGTIDSSGLFTATTGGGPFGIVATVGGTSATGQVWVTSSSRATAPAITTQPVNQTIPVSSNATFIVVASGTAPLNYQWLFNGAAIPGASSTSYTRINVQATDAGNYSVQVTNLAGTVVSSNASLSVVIPPVITTQPLSASAVISSNASFSVVASGTGPLNYQWMLNGATIPGATATSYTRSNVQVSDAGNYSVQVTNLAGKVLSSNATLSVISPPAITTQPLNATVVVGSNFSFSVVASGTAPLNYQWLLNGGAIFGATSSSFSRTNAQTSDAGNYSVQVSNLAGVAISSNATLSILVPPSITTQPISLAVAAGSNAAFSVSASGTLPLSYQWLRNGTEISNATASSYTRTNSQTADAGNYVVVVSNAGGSATSQVAVLTVNNAPVLAAISNQTMHAGSTLRFTNSATDLDAPPQHLAFSLDTGAPPGAAIDAATGIFSWTTATSQASSTNTLTVKVSDDGVPSLTNSRSFVITVVPPLSIASITASNGSVVLRWNSIPGLTYRVQYKNDLGQGAWTSISPDIVASGPTASMADSIGLGQRFYRIQLEQ
jgi:hypothetical protein